MTVLANLLLARHLHCRYGLAAAALFSGKAKSEEIRQRRLIEEIIDFLEIQSIRKKLVGSLPYGMRKRVELGRALALEPKLLVLDEPFAGMNLEEKEDMVRFLVELSESWGQTMILVEHDMSIVMSISERIMVLNFGEKLAEGTPGEIQGNPDVIRAYLGDRAEESRGSRPVRRWPMTVPQIRERVSGNGRPARLDDATLDAYGKYTLPQILGEQAKRLGAGNTAIREKAYGIWQTYNWEDYFSYVRRTALGLLSLGIAAQGKRRHRDEQSTPSGCSANWAPRPWAVSR